MLIIISPSKAQDFNDFEKNKLDSKTSFLKETKSLSEIMKKKSVSDIKKLMSISDNIAELNFKRFSNFNILFSKNNKSENGNYNFRQAIFAFKGSVYKGFDLNNYSTDDFGYLSNHLRIISGFYGFLKPFDLIKPYRLEMGLSLPFKINTIEYKNLYSFWKNKFEKEISNILKKEKVLLNLASVEYSKSINLKDFGDTVVNVDFKVNKKGVLKTIAIFAKQQRGALAN